MQCYASCQLQVARRALQMALIITRLFASARPRQWALAVEWMPQTQTRL